MELVAGGLGQAIAGRKAGAGRPVMPKAAFEITQVSRGRRVTRTGGSFG